MKVKDITPSFDPWEAYLDMEEYGELQLTNIEFTTTNLCNMRCEHCAVGYSLQQKDPDPLPLELFLKRLDEISTLRCISITGGEPMMSLKSVKEYVVPLLKYAHNRGIRTQINSNLTMPVERYELIIPYLDVLHISHNYGTAEDFAEIGFAVMDRKPSWRQRESLFHRMVENSKYLTQKGVMVSAETMINSRTLPHLEKIHEQVIQMGCQRHEIHPMYPSAFASKLKIATLEEIRDGIHRLLDNRDKNIWMLFGTLPFYPCNSEKEDQALLERLYSEKNVTVRNDPDGRSRLNIDIFSGNINVTDFADAGIVGHIQNTSLTNAYNKWRKSKLSKSIDCHCPAVKCLGPNLLVKHAYYKDVNFTARKQLLIR
ncbi:radical SAM/CxCxxxxC motif protein YfkAB [Evansella tamaricis]|uniref:Radical SAM/CxCxxxxC motif protein YfkAB n=1 Tax=Evansella tamaricis TaxID=2069301 RepID=A0ABS6JAG2_9BACI|nr:radical SAM/CxCxxxxC motif protein YfkAB [Evansella tamaricis]MBU9710669.1 radical SAM/CxCxxxxC motif protein YfkAB [Evansella tamaricis]